MSRAIARAILDRPKTCGTFDLVEQHHDAFIWDDLGDELERWNALVGSTAGREDVQARYEDNGQPYFTYKGVTVKVPIQFERGDNTISVHALSQLVKADSDIRFYVETWGNSEFAYLPLPPADWAQLEAQYGKEAVAYRFLPLPPSLDDFWKEWATDKFMHDFADDPEDPSFRRDPQLLAYTRLERELQALITPAYPSLRVHSLSEEYKQTYGLILTLDTDAQCAALRRDQAALRRLKPVIEAFGRAEKLSFLGFRFVSRAAIVRNPEPKAFHMQARKWPLEMPQGWTGKPAPAAPPAAAARPAPATPPPNLTGWASFMAQSPKRRVIQVVAITVVMILTGVLKYNFPDAARDPWQLPQERATVAAPVLSVSKSIASPGAAAAKPVPPAAGAKQPAPNPIATARAMLAVPRTRSSMDYMNDHTEDFIWDDYGEEVQQWNSLVGAAAGLGDVQQRVEGGRDTYLSYKGVKVKVPLQFQRGDNTISVFTMAKLVQKDSEIRMCVDTWGNSEYAYLPLPPAAWAQLESEYGREAVAFRFLKLPATLDAFYAAASSDELAKRTYPDEPREPVGPSVALFTQLDHDIEAQLKPAYPSLQVGFFSVPLARTFELSFTTDTDAQREALRKDAGRLQELEPLIDKTAAATQLHLRGVQFVSRQTLGRDYGGDPVRGMAGIPAEMPAAWSRHFPPPPAAANPLLQIGSKPQTLGVMSVPGAPAPK